MTDQPCTDMERYLFDLNGYVVVPSALSPDELAACNATLDEAEGFVGSEFRGHVYLHNDPARQEGIMLQQMYEAGPVWEKMIDHPNWFAKAVHFIGAALPNPTQHRDHRYGLAPYSVTALTYYVFVNALAGDVPAALARAKPALTRSWIIARSNSANTLNIPNMARPLEVVVSTAC